MAAERPPAGLGTHGTALWKRVAAVFELLPHESAALREACRTIEEVRRLEGALTKADVVTTGSMGQPAVHPLFGELRAHRRALLEQLRAVGLSDADAEGASSPSSAGRALALKGWEKRRGA